jgi:hypothetical protein
MLKKGDVNNDADDDDDEIRTSALQSCVTVTRSTKAFLLRTQYLQLSSHISREVWGAGGPGETGNGRPTQYLEKKKWSQLGSQLPASSAIQ